VKKSIVPILMLLIVFVLKAKAEYVFSDRGVLNLGKSLQVLEGDYPVKKILKGDYDSLFTGNQLTIDSKFNHKTCWVKVHVESMELSYTSWILKTDKHYGDVNCYIIFDNGKIITQRSGWNFPLSKRSLNEADVLFNFSLEPRQSANIYFRIQTNLRWSTINEVKLSLYTYNDWSEQKWKTFLLLFFYLGICVLACFYWLINYIYSKTNNYLLLTFVTLSQLFFILDHFGILTILVFDEAFYMLSQYGFNFIWLPMLTVSFYVLGNSIVKYSETLPKFNYVYVALGIFNTLCPIVTPFIFRWEHSLRISLVVSLISTLTGLITMYYIYNRYKKRGVMLAFWAAMPFFIVFDIYILSMVNVISEDFAHNLIIPLGGLISVIIIFYGMVNYVRILRQKRNSELIEKENLVREQKDMLEKKVEERTSDLAIKTIELENEKRKADELLHNILPHEIALELKQSNKTSVKTYSLVTVMFTDFVGFTTISELVSAELLVSEIDYCFSAFDEIIQKHGIEKIKTVGDAYMCVAGMPVLNYTHAEDMINAAFEIIVFIENRKREKAAKGELPFDIRIGIHSGPVVAGIVGKKKFAYDIWGDTVNLTARMEQNSQAGRINISENTYRLVKNKFRCVHRGKISAKNKGEVDMYFVE
jgi:class 3 adenylate cyclase